VSHGGARDTLKNGLNSAWEYGEGQKGHIETGVYKKESKFEGSYMRTEREEKEIVKRALVLLHSKPEPTSSLPTEGRKVEALEVQESGIIQAVKICSHVLEDEIWLILDRSFIPHDGLACYYAEEIPLLRDKTPEDLRQIHKAKLAFLGARILQEGAEKKAVHPGNEDYLGGDALDGR